MSSGDSHGDSKPDHTVRLSSAISDCNHRRPVANAILQLNGGRHA